MALSLQLRGGDAGSDDHSDVQGGLLVLPCGRRERVRVVEPTRLSGGGQRDSRRDRLALVATRPASRQRTSWAGNLGDGRELSGGALQLVHGAADT